MEKHIVPKRAVVSLRFSLIVGAVLFGKKINRPQTPPKTSCVTSQLLLFSPSPLQPSLPVPIATLRLRRSSQALEFRFVLLEAALTATTVAAPLSTVSTASALTVLLVRTQ